MTSMVAPAALALLIFASGALADTGRTGVRRDQGDGAYRNPILTADKEPSA